jgi:hypothetical protein
MSAGQEGTGADRSTSSRRPLETSQVQHWVHHVGDLATGALATNELDGPLTPRRRAEALAPFAPASGVTFGGPSYSLTPRAPYQASPAAWMIASFVNDFDSGSDLMAWQFPPPGPPGWLEGGVLWSFAVAPEANQALVSVSVFAAAHQGEVGQVVLSAADAGGIEVPISDTYASHTIDLTFVPFAGRLVEVSMNFEPGLSVVTLSGISLGPAGPVVIPVDPI